MFRREGIPDYVKSPHFRRGNVQGGRGTTVRKCVLHLRRRMGNPVAVVPTIVAVIELIQVGGTAVDREEGRRDAGTRVCGGCVRSEAPGAGAGPAEEVLGPGIRGSCSATERGAQTENFIDFMFHCGRQDTDGVGQGHVQTDAATAGKHRTGAARRERHFGQIDPNGSAIG